MKVAERGGIGTSLIVALVVAGLLGLAPATGAQEARAAPPPAPPQCAPDDTTGAGCLLGDPSFVTVTISGAAEVGGILTMSVQSAYPDACFGMPTWERQTTICSDSIDWELWPSRTFRYIHPEGGLIFGHPLDGFYTGDGTCLSTDRWGGQGTCNMEVRNPQNKPLGNYWTAARVRVRFSVPNPDAGFGYSYKTFWVEAPIYFPPDPVDEPPIARIDPPAKFGPGEYQFVGSSSEDPDGGPLSYLWDFDDGTTGAGAVVGHTFTKPGSYNVKLTVTDDEGDTDDATVKVVVEPPELGVGISFPDSSGAVFSVGDEVIVQVAVSADPNGVGDLSQVEFVGDPLRFPEDLFDETEPLTRVTPRAELTLAPGDRLEYRGKLEAKAPGRFTLRSTVRAVDAAGAAVGPVAAQASGKIGTITVEVIPEKKEVALEDNEEGTIPQSVPVTVKVTNPLEEPLTDITLSVLEPTIVSETERDPTQIPFVYLVDPAADAESPAKVPGVPEDVDLGTLGPGKTVEHTFDAQAQDDGTSKLTALVTANVDGQTVTGAGSENVKVVTDIIVYYEDEARGRTNRGGAFWVTGGQSWDVVGMVENRSADEDVLVQLVPQLTGNAGFAVPIPVDVEFPPDEACGIGIIRRLAPGETMRFLAPVRTLPEGGTQGRVVFQPRGFLEDEDGTRTEIAPERILVADGSGDHQTSVDVRDLVPEATTGEIVYSFYIGTMEGFSTFLEGTLALGSMALTAIGTATQPWKWPAAFQAGADKMAGYLTHIYENLTPEEQEQWRSHWTVAVEIALGVTKDEATTMVNGAIAESFTELTTAYYRGDSAAVAKWFGNFVGENPDLVIEALVGAYGVCKLAVTKSGVSTWARSALGRRAVSQAESLERRAALGARALQAGDGLDFARHLSKIFGIDEATHRKLLQLAEKWNIMVVVRRRGFGAIKKLESGDYIPKAMSIKAKNGQFIDEDWLGFRLNDGTSVIDEVAIKQPPPWDEVVGRLRAAGEDQEFVMEVFNRWKKRWEEWHGKGADLMTGRGGRGGERAAWLKYEADGIPYPKKSVGVDYRANVEWGWFVDKSEVHTKLDFRIERQVAPDGREIWRPVVKDPVKGEKYVTGDVDPMAFLKPDGTPLDEATRLKLYEVLEEYGFQHPESMTWTNAKGRNDYFNEFGTHNSASEALAAYMPDGRVVATRFDPFKSWIDPANARAAAGSFTFFREATTVLVARDATPVDLPPIADDEPYVSPTTIFLVDERCQDAAPGKLSHAGANCSIEWSRAQDALVLRQGPDGGLERWTQDGGWHPFTAVSSALGVLPQTLLTQDVPAGATQAEVRSAPEMGLPGALADWFAVGDLIVIDPGGPNEEYVRVAGFGSLVFDRPLTKSHGRGEVISLVAGTDRSVGTGSGVGLVDPATGHWYLRSDDGAATTFTYGDPADYPFMGDWDCDGVDTPGLFRQSDGFVYLRNSNTMGIADVNFFFGNPDDIPLAGDFDGDGCDTVSLYRPGEARVYIVDRLGSNRSGLGAADYFFTLGDPGDKPFVGDVDGDGIDEVGLFRPYESRYYEWYEARAGTADLYYTYADPHDYAFVGDWDGDGRATPGAFRASEAKFYLRNTNGAGPADRSFSFGEPGWMPVVGTFGTS